MTLILYLPLTEGAGRQLYEIAKRVVPKGNIELYRSIQELSGRLHRPLFGVKAAVLWAVDRENLVEITCLGCFLDETRIILVLPDHDPETIAKGHLLRPRFVAWQGDDFSRVETYLRNVLGLHEESCRWNGGDAVNAEK